MSWIFTTGFETTVNFASATSQWAWLLKELLKTAGWEVQASSDGTNVSNTPGNGNDQITTVGEMNTNNAWYVIKQPAIASGWGRAGGRQFIVRRGTSVTTWMIAYVPLDADEVAQTPTANGTTSAVPTFTTTKILNGTLPDTAATLVASTATNRYMIGANNEAPYGFFMGGWTLSGAASIGSMIFDPLEADSVHRLDEDPYIVGAVSGSAWGYTNLMHVTTGFSGYYRKGLTGEQFVVVPATCLLTRGAAENVIVPGCIGRGPYDKYEETLPMWYVRPTVQGAAWTGYGMRKGVSSIWTWKMGSWISGTRRSVRVDNDRVVLGDALVPWPPSTAPHWGI